jgi:hypothetical protein
MIVTDKFVFVHLLRSGGTFVSEVIRKFFPSAHEIGYHLPQVALPKEYSHLPVLGTVRNPWAFYPSWYHHHHSDNRYLPLFCSLSENRKLDFVQTIRNALNLGVSDDKLDFLTQELPEDFNYQERHISNLTRDVMRKIRGTGLGLYTFRFNQMFGQADDVFFCRVESLRSDLMAFFDRIGAASDALRSYVFSLDKKNISEHLHYSTYYTPELAELVSIRDRPLIERFGYVFEQSSSVEDGGPKSSIEKPTTRRVNKLTVGETRGILGFGGTVGRRATTMSSTKVKVPRH